MMTKQSLAEENFSLGSNTYRTNAIPNVGSFARNVELEESQVKSSVESGNFKEYWPGSDVTDVSKVTENSITSDVEHLSISAVLEENKTCQNTESENTESVLQRYIDRFRNSAPKSREERSKERKQQSQDFWWLEKHSTKDLPARDEKVKAIGDQIVTEKVKAEPAPRRPKLTREALLAMDEETEKLQKKADLLLCQSEGSLASSGPIVSTVGLASSTVSESSIGDLQIEQTAYRPAFVSIQEQAPKARPSTSLFKTRKVPAKTPVSESKVDGGDILSRWRMRRKVSESATNLSSNVNSTRHSKMDPRLEDFRKKLFAQKAAIIQNDIDFERQKMRLLLDEEEVQPQKKHRFRELISSLDPTAVRLTDPVLDRLRQVTEDATFQRTSSLQNQNSTKITQNNNTALFNAMPDLNSNNLNQVRKNKNYNIASLNTNNRENKVEDAPGVLVDTFASQVICDPTSRSHSLHSSIRSSHESDAKCSLSPEKESDKVKTGDIEKDPKYHESKIPQSKIYLSNENSFEEELESTETEQGRDDIELRLKPADLSPAGNVFHQVLVAEKPSEENTVSKTFETSKLRIEPEVENVSLPQRGLTVNKSNISKKSRRRLNSNESLKSVNEKDLIRKKDESVCRDEENCSEVRRSDHTSKKNETKSSVKKGIDFFNSNIGECQIESKQIQTTERLELPVIQQSISPAPKSVPNPNPSPGTRPSSQPMQTAIGQTISEHLFDTSALISSVDSWASMFPQSPARSRVLPDTVLETPSPSGNTSYIPMESTPVARQSLIEETETEDLSSDGEFADDPLLVVLRQQRSLQLDRLQKISNKIQSLQER